MDGKHHHAWGAPSSYKISIIIKSWALHQNLKEWSKPLRWDAIDDCWSFPVNTMWWNRVHNKTGVCDDLLTKMKLWKLRWYGNIMKSSGILNTTIPGTVKRMRWKTGHGKHGMVLLHHHQWCPFGHLGWKTEIPQLHPQIFCLGLGRAWACINDSDKTISRRKEKHERWFSGCI